MLSHHKNWPNAKGMKKKTEPGPEDASLPPQRDKKSGHWLPGHINIPIKPGNPSGRPKSILGLVRQELGLAEDAMPEIIAAMIARATGKVDCTQAVQQAAGEYLCDRIYGKPNQPLSGVTGQPVVLVVRDWKKPPGSSDV